MLTPPRRAAGNSYAYSLALATQARQKRGKSVSKSGVGADRGKGVKITKNGGKGYIQIAI